MTELLHPFHFEFFRNGVAVATIAGAVCGLVGVFVVLKGMSYIGHGLSHAMFGGFAASALLGVNVVVGAGVWGIAAALMVGGVSRRQVIGADAAVGVVTTASFAVGLALFSLFGQRGRNFDAALFGTILGVERRDVLAVAAVGLAVAAMVAVAYRRLLFATFDPHVAEASGVPVARIDAVLMAALAASILTTMQVVGVTLIAATLVIPPTVARMLSHSFARVLVLSTVIGSVTGFVGMNLSYHLDVQPGPTIVLVGASLFVIAFSLEPLRRRGRRAPGTSIPVAGGG